MKKMLYVIAFVLLTAIVGGYATLSITMTDLFSTGNDGSGNPLFRIDSNGGIVTQGDVTVNGNDIVFGNAETITNSTNGQIGFTDGTNTLATVIDDGTTGTVSAANHLASSGKYGYTSSAGNTLYTVILATTMAGDSSVDLTLADGKAGMFEIIIGTTAAWGSFTSAAAVTLTTASGTTSTTASTPASINISDGGSVVRVTNKAFASAVAYIRYWYIN